MVLSVEEKRIEQKCAKIAFDLGFFLLKLLPWVETGLPDRLLLAKGRVVFIEFKRPKGKPSPKQRLWRKRLTKLGLEHYYCFSVEDFYDILAGTPSPHQIPKAA